MEEDASRGARYVKKGLRLAHLRLFQALRRTGSLSRAAESLATSQPAASRLLSEAEAITGAKLAERQGRGMILTLYGERLAERADVVMRELDEAEREIENLKTGLSGTVSVGAVTGAAVEYMLPALRQTRVTHPEVSINVDVSTSDQLAVALEAGRIDFYIGRVPDRVNARMFETLYLDEEPICVIGRAGHPLARRKNLTLHDCVAYDWILQPEGSMLRFAIESYMRSNEIPYPAKILSTSSVLLTLMAISQSNGLTALAQPVADFFTSMGARSGEGAAAVIKLPVDQAISIAPYSIVKLAGRNLSPATQTFLTLIRDISDRSRKAGVSAP